MGYKKREHFNLNWNIVFSLRIAMGGEVNLPNRIKSIIKFILYNLF